MTISDGAGPLAFESLTIAPLVTMKVLSLLLQFEISFDTPPTRRLNTGTLTTTPWRCSRTCHRKARRGGQTQTRCR